MKRNMSAADRNIRVMFDPTDSTLNPELSGLFLSLKIDLVNNRLQKGKNERNVYVKVN